MFGTPSTWILHDLSTVPRYDENSTAHRSIEHDLHLAQRLCHGPPPFLFFAFCLSHSLSLSLSLSACLVSHEHGHDCSRVRGHVANAFTGPPCHLRTAAHLSTTRRWRTESGN